MQKYIDMFISRLDNEIKSTGNEVINAVKWFHYLTADIIGELTVGESFGELENNEMHSWLESIFWSLKHFSLSWELSRYPRWVACLMTALIIPRGHLVHSTNAIGLVAEKAHQRIKR